MVLSQEFSFQCSCLAKAYHLNIDKMLQHHVTLPFFDGCYPTCQCALCLMNITRCMRCNPEVCGSLCDTDILSVGLPFFFRRQKHYHMGRWATLNCICKLMSVWPCNELETSPEESPVVFSKTLRNGSNSPTDHNWRRRVLENGWRVIVAD